MASNDDIQDIARALEIFMSGKKETAISILLDVRDKTKSRHVRNLVYRTLDTLKLDSKNFAATEQ